MISLENDKAVKQYPLREGLLYHGDHFLAETLNGGVSCRAWKVEIDEKIYVIKLALSRLNVQAVSTARQGNRPGSSIFGR